MSLIGSVSGYSLFHTVDNLLSVIHLFVEALVRSPRRCYRWGMSFLLVMTVATIVFIVGRGCYGQGYLDGWNLLSNLIVTAIIAGIMLRYLFIQQQLRNSNRPN